jgi:hypothetical protein
VLASSVLNVAVQDDWTTVFTAIGTVAAAVAAVGIAIWSDWRTGNRVEAEQLISRQQLATQQEFSRQQLVDQQEFSRNQLAEERQADLAKDQLAEAYMVRVELGARDIPVETDPVYDEPTGPMLKRVAAMVVNGGSFVITKVEARFVVQGNIQSPKSYHLLPGDSPFPRPAGYFWRSIGDSIVNTTLPPWTAGVLIEANDVNPDRAVGAYVIIRWTDRWDKRWEHNRGAIKQVGETDPWESQAKPEPAG